MSSMAPAVTLTAAERDAILSVAREHNRGDVALGRKVSDRREGLLNAQDLKQNIEPMDLVNRAAPSANYQFAWCPLGDNDYFQDLRDDGYKPVIEAEWICERWEWMIPERDKWRWNESRHLLYRDNFLMYRDEALWAQQMRRRERQNENSIRANTDKAVQQAQSHGMAVEGEIAGQAFAIPAPARRKSVS